MRWHGCVHECACAARTGKPGCSPWSRKLSDMTERLNNSECICAFSRVSYPCLPPLLDGPSQDPLWSGVLTTFSGVSLQIAKGSLRTSSCWAHLWTEKPSTGSLSGRWSLEGSSMATAGLSRARAPGELTTLTEHLVSQ